MKNLMTKESIQLIKNTIKNVDFQCALENISTLTMSRTSPAILSLLYDTSFLCCCRLPPLFFTFSHLLSPNISTKIIIRLLKLHFNVSKYICIFMECGLVYDIWYDDGQNGKKMCINL